MTFFQAMLLAVIEGLTEYLPVSSTGHIILGSWMMGLNQDPFVKDYTVMVQFGAILAVLALYWRKFLLNTKLYPIVLAGFLPAAMIGLAVKSRIDRILGSVWLVGVMLLVGGVLLVLTDRWLQRHKTRVTQLEQMPLPSAFKIGLFQCLAFFPGVSRSAASIWGGLYQGLGLVSATEFSFFLAVPTLTGATFLKLLKVRDSITSDQWEILLYGNLVSFVVGLLAIRFFIQLIERFGLRHFGYYRILVGLAVLTALSLGHDIDFL